MSRAENPNTTKPSRRTVLAGISVAATPVAAALAGQPGDHELLALNAQLYALWPELIAVRQASRAACDTADEEVARRLGFNTQSIGLTREQGDAAWATTKLVRSELGTEDEVAREAALWNRVDQVHMAIMGAPPRTLVGAAIQARAAAMLALSELWDEPKRDLDWEKQVTRNLIEGICAAAGMPLPFDDVGAA